MAWTPRGRSCRIREPVSPPDPLAGRTVLVTRPAERAGSLRQAFERVGARVVSIPTTRFGSPDDPALLARAVERIDVYDWVVLSSVTGVDRLAGELEKTGAGLEGLRRARVAAVGPATADALARLGVPEPLTPETYVGESLARAVIRSTPANRREGARVLVARAQEARPELPTLLREAGFEVDEVAAYATRVHRAARDELTAAVESGDLHWLTFTAASTVRGFVELVGARTGGARVAAIGPVTGAVVRDLGLPLDARASTSTAEGLVDAVVEAERRGAGSEMVR